MPRGGVLGESVHLVGERPLDAVGQRHRLEDLALCGPHSHPDLLQARGRSLVVQILGARAGHLGQRSIHGADHVGQGDVPSTTCQRPPALGATTRLDQVGTPQIGEDRP